MNKINRWFTSDTHYAHKNICKGQSTWEDKSQCRDFETVDEMNDTLVNNINAVVGPEDHLYHNGDFAFGRGPENIIEFRNRINCKNVFFFIGNHDRLIKNDKELQKLFLKVRLKATLRIEDQDIVFNHFPEIIWDKHHHGAIHLYGHCHNSLNEVSELDYVLHDRKCMDIGIDTHPEFRPYHFDEIMEIMDNKVVRFLDHHTKRQ